MPNQRSLLDRLGHLLLRRLSLETARSGPPPPEPVDLSSGEMRFATPVTGTQHYQQILQRVRRDAVLRQETPDAPLTFTALLVREPDNLFDSGAVAVHSERHGSFGYLAPDDAARLAPALERFVTDHKQAQVPACLGGGDDAPFSVRLDLAPPGV